MSAIRYRAQDLENFATELLEKTGLASERASIFARLLLEADLMGHSTHGLNLLAPYLEALESGGMTKDGDPRVIRDSGAAIAWDGRYLPGPWLTMEALKLASARIKEHPVVTMTIQHSHHIACLAVYPKFITDQGYLLMLGCSDPNEKGVAPYGGIEAIYSPDPLAVGIPTKGDPIIMDISMSNTAIGYVSRARNEGQRMKYPWLMDNQGNLTDDPNLFFTEPRGSILPLGGLEAGYKGFALGLMMEALTGALSGQGRSTNQQRWGASVFLQVMDPNAFGGADYFTQETQWLADACRSSATRPGDPPVRLPGQRGFELRAQQIKDGVHLYPAIIPALEPWADKLQVSLPPTC